MLNKGSTANPSMMHAVRELFWWSAVHDFELTAVYLPGEENIFSDCVSRLDANRWLLQWALLNQCEDVSPSTRLLCCQPYPTHVASLPSHSPPSDSRSGRGEKELDEEVIHR